MRRAVPLLALALACSGEKQETNMAAAAQLPPGILAMVGDTAISTETVQRIANAQHVSAEDALNKAISDALLAARAPCGTGNATRAALARATLAQLAREARGAGEPTTEELDFLRERQWWEIDRPVMRRSVQAVVLIKEDTDKALARKVADQIWAAVKDTRYTVPFETAAASVDKQGLEVVNQRLPPATSDGRALELEQANPHGTRAQSFVQEFTKPLFEIDKVGDVSGVIETSFGFHVIQLSHIYKEQRLPPEELRAFLTPQVYDMRAQVKVEALLTGTRQKNPPEFLREWGEATHATVGWLESAEIRPCGAQ